MDLSERAREIFVVALDESRIDQAFHRKVVTGIGEKPFILRLQGENDEPEFLTDMSGVERVFVVAAGKAAASMLQGLLKYVRFPPNAQLSCVLIAPQKPLQLPDSVEFFAGGHPLPTEESFAGARAVLRLLEEVARIATKQKVFCFFLISGGASAMLELPITESISLADTIIFHRVLIHSGATIAEINSLRKHFSAVKGGRLGQMVADIPSLTIMVSDVPAKQLDSLASGPTIPDSSTVTQCLEIAERYGLMSQFPSSVRNFFTSGKILETPKPGSFHPRVVTLLSSDDLARAARRKAESLGYTAVIDNGCDDWEYRDAVEYLLARFRELRRLHKRVCLISAGEITVRLSTGISDERAKTDTAIQMGKGGRNQHFVLYAATLLQPEDGRTVVLSAGSDGVDGNSSFAGAVLNYDGLQYPLVTGSSDCISGIGAALDALDRFDSSSFLSSRRATIASGPTGNNLRDLRLILNE